MTVHGSPLSGSSDPDREQTVSPQAPSFDELVAILTDPDVLAGKHLPQAEQDEHRRCCESIVQARRWAEAHAHEFYVGARSEHWHVWICPYCGHQYRGPAAHPVAGDDMATSCSHAHPGERGVIQPRLIRVAVVPAEPFVLQEVPHDRPIALSEGFDER